MSVTPENPQPIDNPATPDVDADFVVEPQSARDAGAFQQQADEQPQGLTESDAMQPQPGEPVVQPSAIENSGTDEAIIVPNTEQRSTEGEVRIDVVEHDGAADDDAEDDGEPEPDAQPPAH